MLYIQPKTIKGKYSSNNIKLGDVIVINGNRYTVEVIGAKAISREDRVDAVPNRTMAIVCAMDNNKTIFNLKLI